MAKNEAIEQKIKETLEQIRPYLQADGGDVTLVEVTDDYTVRVKLLGACGSCPMRIQTLKMGVEKAVQKAVPEVKEVVSVE